MTVCYFNNDLKNQIIHKKNCDYLRSIDISDDFLKSAKENISLELVFLLNFLDTKILKEN